MAETTGAAAQDFWLENLGQAGRFNAWVMAEIAPFLGRRVLEVGCGIGTFTALMSVRGHAVSAVDINPEYVTAARRRLAGTPGVEVAEGDATAMDWPQAFDTVVVLDVLEHIADDVGFLRRLSSALRPGGNLVIKVPAGRWLYSPMDEAIGHHRRYTPRALTEAYTRAGFGRPQVKWFNAAGVLGWWLNGRVLKRETPPATQVGLFERLLPAIRAADRLNPLPIGLSLIASARLGKSRVSPFVDPAPQGVPSAPLGLSSDDWRLGHGIRELRLVERAGEPEA
jgi:SAM-dependent methyltransferase